jgi:hypothetical protein
MGWYLARRAIKISKKDAVVRYRFNIYRIFDSVIYAATGFIVTDPTISHK